VVWWAVPCLSVRGTGTGLGGRGGRRQPVEAQDALFQDLRRSWLREVACDDLFGGGVAEAERGRDEPVGWEVAVEVAGTLSTLGESLEDGGEGLVRVTVRGCADPDNDRLVALGVPLLVIFGQEDARYSSSSAADYRTVPGARIEVLAGVGHTPMLEDPPTTARLLRELTTTPGAPNGDGDAA
jgi:pimeloyl-ACP methyl ester carboxylesterase